MNNINKKLKAKQYLSPGEFNFFYQLGKNNPNVLNRIVNYIGQFLIKKKN